MGKKKTNNKAKNKRNKQKKNWQFPNDSIIGFLKVKIIYDYTEIMEISFMLTPYIAQNLANLSYLLRTSLTQTLTLTLPFIFKPN